MKNAPCNLCTQGATQAQKHVIRVGRPWFAALHHPIIPCLSALTLLAATCNAWGAQEALAYPVRPVRIITGPIGGAMDINSRIIAAELAKQTGQQVIVDNRPGAGGIIGMEIVARAAPDGYTVGQVPSNFVANPTLYAKLPYDSERDFLPVIHTGASTLILAASPVLPIRSVKEMLAYARANPGKLAYGGLGMGSVSVLSMELLKHQTGTTIALISYKSPQQAITELMSGQIQLMCEPSPSILPFVRSGKLRGLAVATLKRSPAVPDLPTIDEAGVPGYEATFRTGGLLVQAKVPRAIVLRLNTEINKALQSPAVLERYAADGYTAGGGTPEEYAAHLRAETIKWGKVIKAAGITPQ